MPTVDKKNKKKNKKKKKNRVELIKKKKKLTSPAHENLTNIMQSKPSVTYKLWIVFE